MTITTREFTIDRDAFARMLRTQYFRRYSWAYGVFFVGAIAGTVWSMWLLTLWLAFSGVALMLYRLYAIRRYVRHPDNEIIFAPRRYVFTPEWIEAVCGDGSEGRSPTRSVIRTERGPDHTRLYLSKLQFHYIPDDAFMSETDRSAFAALFVI